ncbi:unnamed protein product [Linum trigynum]|uniref:Gnk2-homologous domain-containing protein n=1 Tax=Linum trigynum TaxID=586398 RepID=A0AAV2E2N1_9ROSI
MVRLLVMITISTIFFATGFAVSYPFYKKYIVCIPAGPDGRLVNYAWNETRLASGRNVQDQVLADMKDRLNHVPHGFVDLCTVKNFDGNDNLFVGCTAGIPSGECQDCVGKATAVIRDKCPDGVGAQAAAPKCCVRYETYKFCEL